MKEFFAKEGEKRRFGFAAMLLHFWVASVKDTLDGTRMNTFSLNGRDIQSYILRAQQCLST